MSSRRTVALLRREAARLIGTGSGTAALDARIIVAYVLGWPAEKLSLRDDDAVDDTVAAAVLALAARRAKGEPVARLTGEKEFYGRFFALTPETLVPRSDTETLVDATIAAVEEHWSRRATLNILDLGTGSGAILVTLLAELPNCRGVGIDIATGAVAAARANAERHGVQSRAQFTAGDWSRRVKERFDVVVSNPPYIETAIIPTLQVDVRDHDPHLALDGGADGFDAIHDILLDLGRILTPGGVALIEIGAGQAATMKELADAHGFRCDFRPDIGGIDRVAVLTRARDSGATEAHG